MHPKRIGVGRGSAQVISVIKSGRFLFHQGIARRLLPICSLARSLHFAPVFLNSPLSPLRQVGRSVGQRSNVADGQTELREEEESMCGQNSPTLCFARQAMLSTGHGHLVRNHMGGGGGGSSEYWHAELDLKQLNLKAVIRPAMLS